MLGELRIDVHGAQQRLPITRTCNTVHQPNVRFDAERACEVVGRGTCAVKRFENIGFQEGYHRIFFAAAPWGAAPRRLPLSLAIVPLQLGHNRFRGKLIYISLR